MSEFLLSDSLVWKCLDTDKVVVPTLYLITEMLVQSCKLALICMGLQSGVQRGGWISKGHLYY